MREDDREMSQVTYQPEERARLYRQLTDEAIQLALKSQWDEAAEVNRQLLASFPHDLSSLNRLGKALSELGQYAEAKKAYSEAIEVDPANNIARKNLDRLAQVGEEATERRGATERIDPRLFIEETGKTGFTDLVDLAPRGVLAKLAAGEQVRLRPEGKLLYIENAAGERLGRIEPRLANRLIGFMEGGNQYAAGIADLNGHAVRIIIRETFQDPSQFGRVSFPAQQTGGETIRPYIKDSMLRYGHDEEDEIGEDGEYLDDDGEEEAEERAEGEELETESESPYEE